MAAILSNEEQRDFQSFLDTFDNSDGATLVGGSSLVVDQDSGSGHAQEGSARPAGWGAQDATRFFDQAAHSAATRHATNGANGPASPAQAQAHSLRGFPAFSLPNSSRTSSAPTSAARAPLSSTHDSNVTEFSLGEDAMTDGHIDQNKLERMAQQARELSEWMRSHGAAVAGSGPGPGSTTSGNGHVYHQPPGHHPTYTSFNEPASLSERSTFEYGQRPPLASSSNERTSAEDAMELMRQAEERAGFSRRLRAVNDSLYEPEGGIVSADSATALAQRSPATFGAGGSGGGTFTTVPAHYSSYAVGRHPLPQPPPPPRAPHSQALGFATPPPRTISNSRRISSASRSASISQAPPVAPMPEDEEEGEDEDAAFEDDDDEYPPPRSAPAPAPPPAAPASAPTKRKRKAAAAPASTSAPKPRRTAAASTSTASLVQSTSASATGEGHSADLNPAPFTTPSNIPASTYVPPKNVARRPRPSLVASTSSFTSAAVAKPDKGPDGKPVLLTAEQKKANHIASEQKRRAAIRMGYESLCGVVPSLRAAVEEFEERVKKLGGGGAGAGAAGGSGKKRRGGASGAGASGGAVAGPLSGGIEVGGEKVDGRAGPKSEAVVLGKTVDYLRALLIQRQTALERLSNAYQLAADNNIELEGGRRVWDEHWDGSAVAAGEEHGGSIKAER